MSYVKDSLGSDEKILMIARFPWPYHVAAWGALLLLGIVVVYISATVSNLCCRCTPLTSLCLLSHWPEGRPGSSDVSPPPHAWNLRAVV